MSKLKAILLPAAVAVMFAGPLADTAVAQADKVYELSELSSPPKLASAVNTARLIQESYPTDLKNRGVGGMVVVEFVVDAKGKVDPASIQVVDATQTALGEAAKKVVPKLDFNPGKLNGSAVKSKVVLPIVYKAK